MTDHVTVGPDMPSDEFAELLDRQPKLEARWQESPMRESCETVGWDDLTPAQKHQVRERRNAESQLPTAGFAGIPYRQRPATAAPPLQPAKFGHDWPTPNWGELADYEKARLYRTTLARAEAAEKKLAEVRLFVSTRRLRALDRGRGYVNELSEILGMSA